MFDVEVTIIVETFNLGEGSFQPTLRRTLVAANRIAAERDGTEVLLADCSPAQDVGLQVASGLTHVRVIDCARQSYDESKATAIARSRGRFIVFLDGDCVPAKPGWLDAHLRTMRALHGRVASFGFTQYERSFFQDILSILDFGFLQGESGDTCGCYACNNVAFPREVLEACPLPVTSMRCSCYLHGQQLERGGMPGRLTREAHVLHEPKPFWKERLRRGYDHVAAHWDDGGPDSQVLRYGLAATPLFYLRELRMDYRRLRRGWRQFGLTRSAAIAAALILPVVRFADVPGIAFALAIPPRRRTGVPAAT